MEQKIKSYKEKLKHSIAEYMDMSITDRSAVAIKSMIECLNEIEKLENRVCSITPDELEHWNNSMINDDGTVGGKWTIEQTTDIANMMYIKFEHITELMWNVTMNMMYSDYYNIGCKYGLNAPEFYAEMAKAFLFDKDAESPSKKLFAYYNNIVKK